MNSLFTYLAKRIVIDLHPFKFTFSITEKDISISFAPFLWLHRDEKMWMPIAIGEEIPAEHRNNPDIVRIDINDLGNNLPSKSVISSDVFLQLLFEYGISRCFESSWIPQLKPVVFIYGSNRFNEHFKNPKEMFEIAAKRGGAKYVVFDTMKL